MTGIERPAEVSKLFKLFVWDYYFLLRNIPEASPLYAFLRNGAIVSDSRGCMTIQILCDDEQQAKILASLAQRISSNAVHSIEEGSNQLHREFEKMEKVEKHTHEALGDYSGGSW